MLILSPNSSKHTIHYEGRIILEYKTINEKIEDKLAIIAVFGLGTVDCRRLWNLRIMVFMSSGLILMRNYLRI